MLIDGCVLDVDAFLTAPLQRTSPENDWAEARENGVLPPSIYLFYQKTMFLSFGAAPDYLKDETNVLFSYLGMILRGLKESFAEAHETQRAFAREQSRVYDPGKKLKGETWDKDADLRARRHLRHFLFALCNGLDTMADLVALMLPGIVPRLELGEAQFVRIEKWLEKPLTPPSQLVTPAQDVASRLHGDLRALVKCKDPERGWLPYLRHLRNKAAHLGDSTFREFGLHDAGANFYVFVPRIWPFIWEQEIKAASQQGKPVRSNTPALLRKRLMHQDIISFTGGALAKVTAVAECVVGLMSECYTQFENFPLNQAAITELNSNSLSFSFKKFSG